MFKSGIFPVLSSDALQGNMLLPLQGSQVAQLHSSSPGAGSDSVSGCRRLQQDRCLTTQGLKTPNLGSKGSVSACHSSL